MKKLFFITAIALLTFGHSYAEASKDVKELKVQMSNGFLREYSTSEVVTNYSIETSTSKLSGDFTKYSYTTGIDTILTNSATYQYFAGKKDCVIISVIESGIAKGYVDINADGILDEFISGGKKYTGIAYQKGYETFLDFALHG